MLVPTRSPQRAEVAGEAGKGRGGVASRARSTKHARGTLGALCGARQVAAVRVRAGRAGVIRRVDAARWTKVAGLAFTGGRCEAERHAHLTSGTRHALVPGRETLGKKMPQELLKTRRFLNSQVLIGCHDIGHSALSMQGMVQNIGRVVLLKFNRWQTEIKDDKGKPNTVEPSDPDRLVAVRAQGAGGRRLGTRGAVRSRRAHSALRKVPHPR